MKIIKNIIITIMILLLIAYAAIYIFISTNAKKIISDNLSKTLGKNVTIGSINLSPPFTINIKDLSIEDLLTLGKLQAEPSIAALLFGKLGLNRINIENSTLFVIRTGTTEFNFSPVIENLSKSSGQKISFFVKEAFVRNSQIHFEDELTELSLDISPRHLSVVTSLVDFKTTFNLVADIISNRGRDLADISFVGWANFLKKDMDAKLSIRDVELTYFTPYFEKFLSRLQSGRLFFNANAVSYNNDLAVDCRLEAHNLKFMEEALLGDMGKKNIVLFDDLSNVVLGSLLGSGRDGAFDFSIHTKFDNPKLEGLKFKGNIKSTIENIIATIPEQGIEEEIKKIGEDFEDMGKEFKEQFKDMGDKFKKQMLEEILGSEQQGAEPQEAIPQEATSNSTASQ